LILVDTDFLIEIFNRNSEKGDKALKKIERTGEDVTTTSLNLHEILYGLHKYTDHVKLERILVLDVVEFTKDDAVLSSKLEIETEKKGKKVP